MIRTDSKRGRTALIVAHCAGMLDMVALPVWIGALVGHYALDPQQAGLVVTLFLGGVVLASLVLAPRFGRVSTRAVATLSFAACAIGFGLASQVTDFMPLAVIHLLCGLAVGAALSVTHGTIALSARPHRLFAIVNTALGVSAIFYLGATPQIVGRFGGASLFIVFGAVMLVAALVSLLAFPSADAAQPGAQGVADTAAARPSAGFGAVVWFGIAGVALLALVQAMTFSFVERIGVDRGFGVQAVAAVLIALGIVNLLPAPLAAVLERRVPARGVLLCAPVCQAALALTITHSPVYVAYAATSAVFVAVVVFAHTFAFGLLARLEPTGRAMSATPAMLMTGDAIGPVLGGTLVKFFGYHGIGVAAALVAACAVYCFSRLPRDSAAPHAVPVVLGH